MSLSTIIPSKTWEEIVKDKDKDPERFFEYYLKREFDFIKDVTVRLLNPYTKMYQMDPSNMFYTPLAKIHGVSVIPRGSWWCRDGAIVYIAKVGGMENTYHLLEYGDGTPSGMGLDQWNAPTSKVRRMMDNECGGVVFGVGDA